MKRIALACLLLCVVVSGEEPVGKKSGTVALGKADDDRVVELFEVYEDWDRGYFIYKQTETFTTYGPYKVVTVSITAVPIRSDWPPKVKAEEDGK